jgi:hypothetical protein
MNKTETRCIICSNNAPSNIFLNENTVYINIKNINCTNKTRLQCLSSEDLLIIIDELHRVLRDEIIVDIKKN